MHVTRRRRWRYCVSSDGGCRDGGQTQHRLRRYRTTLGNGVSITSGGVQSLPPGPAKVAANAGEGDGGSPADKGSDVRGVKGGACGKDVGSSDSRYPPSKHAYICRRAGDGDSNFTTPPGNDAGQLLPATPGSSSVLSTFPLPLLALSGGPAIRGIQAILPASSPPAVDPPAQVIYARLPLLAQFEAVAVAIRCRDRVQEDKSPTVSGGIVGADRCSSFPLFGASTGGDGDVRAAKGACCIRMSEVELSGLGNAPAAVGGVPGCRLGSRGRDR